MEVTRQIVIPKLVNHIFPLTGTAGPLGSRVGGEAEEARRKAGWEGLQKAVRHDEIKDKAREIAENVVGHIDTMYPDMWKNVAKSARVSVRGTVINSVMAAFGESK